MRGQGIDKVGVSQRGSKRLRMRARATLKTWRGNQFVEISDVSQAGARLALSSTHEFTAATLEWQGIAAHGRVVWREPRACGFRFDQELPLEWLVEAQSVEAV